jgi:hypothetical protein
VSENEKAPQIAVLRASQPSPDEMSGSMVPRGGIEPPTRGFSVRCSTS